MHKANSLRALFARSLTRRRKHLGLTLAQAAARAKFSTSYLAMLESGARSPSLETVGHVARALGFGHPREMFRG